MDRKLARRNIVMGVSLLFIILALLAFTLVWAGLYLDFVH